MQENPFQPQENENEAQRNEPVPPPGSDQPSQKPQAEEPQPESQPQQREEPRPSKETQLPRWMRAEMGEDVQAEEQQASAAEDPAEIARLRSEVEYYRGEANRYRREASQVQQTQYIATARGRGGCLTAWLIFLGALDVLIILFSCIAFGALGLGALLNIAVAGIALVGISGTWNLQKWGYYLMMSMYTIGLILDVLQFFLAQGAPSAFLSGIVSLVAMGILFLLVHDRWEEFE